MSLDKAPSLDGFLAKFYQTFYGIIKSYLIKVVESRKNKVMLEDLNNTLMVLILKKEKFVELEDFRMIFLCNMVYKIISKVIMNRLTIFLPTIILKALEKQG